jgi:hypothetical protein
MMARTWTALVGTACLAAGISGCGGGYSGTCGAAARVPLAPAGVYVDDDVADGYAAYAGTLASAGSWSADSTYGVHWCPAAAPEGEAFRPYVSRGHWATAEQPVHGAPPGTPYWVSDDAAPWSDVTTHHGYWIDLAKHFSGRSEWCWVPGAQETPARVVWREGDGFVGWAPEPPVWVDDGDENVAVGFEWSFELLGTLLEDAGDGVDSYSARCSRTPATAWTATCSRATRRRWRRTRRRPRVTPPDAAHPSRGAPRRSRWSSPRATSSWPGCARTPTSRPS